MPSAISESSDENGGFLLMLEHAREFCFTYDILHPPAMTLKQREVALNMHRSNAKKKLQKLNDAFQAVLGTGDVFHVEQRKPTTKAHKVYQRCQKLLLQCRELERKAWTPTSSNQLTVAASETVVDFLLPLVASGFFESRSDDSLDLRQTTLSPDRIARIEDEISLDLVDIAIAWTGYGWRYDSTRVTEKPLPTSKTHISLLLRHDHDLAAGLNVSTPARRDALAETVVVYPDLPQLQSLAANLSKYHYKVPSVMAVVNQVRTSKRVVGLIPGWTWLVNELTDLYSLLIVPLDSKERMELLAILSANDSSHHANAYLEMVENTLRVLCNPAMWELSVEDIPLKLSRKAMAEPWFTYHITKGPLGERVRPRWIEGNLRLSKWNESAIHGHLIWEGLGQFEITGVLAATRYVLLNVITDSTTLRGDEKRPKRAGCVCLSRRLTPPMLRHSENVVCLVGTFAYEANDLRPTASPMMFCNQRLPPEHLASFERSYSISLLRSGGPPA